MAGHLIISSPQNRVKDCYAPAPKIDLTLRTNGEEKVSVITPVGDVVQAGFDAPAVAPTVAVASSGATWVANQFWNYVYVYVASQYALVENAVTGGGAVSPRSNPSPSVQTDSSADTTHGRTLSIPTSSRLDIDKIWIYRTVLFGTAAEATNAAAAGNIFYIGVTTNNASLATVPFTDANVTLQEQIETDNYVAPQARYCVFDGQYFWMIGNDDLTYEVTMTSTGFVTVTDPLNLWFDGRNAQIGIFDGVSTGGFDNRGSFYVKILSTNTIQLYQDIGLTIPIGVSPVGTTLFTIRGQATILYRSKPRNPFSWGATDLIGDVQVPSPYNFSLGGGRSTSLAIIPNLNLLKIDTEAPNKCYTLNLKNSGTPNFETSLRPISDTYCSSVHFAQFSATSNQGRSSLWSLDTKSFTIVQCDGATQAPVSDPVYASLRTISLDENDRHFFHGNYLPRLELNCMFVRTQGATNQLNLCFFYHWPTNQWGMVDVFDILCSAQILDPFTNELKLIVGSASGMIGEFAAKDQYFNWTDTPLFGKLTRYDSQAYPPTNDVFTCDAAYDFSQPGILYNWMLLYEVLATAPTQLINFRFARIANIAAIAEGWRITCDTMYHHPLQPGTGIFTWPDGDTNITYFRVGLVEMIMGRMFNAGIPFEGKKVESIQTSWVYEHAPDIIEAPVFTLGQQYKWTYSNGVFFYQTPLDFKSMTNPIYTNPDYVPDFPIKGFPQVPVQFGKVSNFVIDESPVFGILIADRNYLPAQLMNYEVRLSTDAHGSNN